MRIGINGRPLTAPLTGIGRYTFEMTQALLRQGADIVLLSPSPLPCRLDPANGKLELVADRVTSRIGRQYWELVTLPRLVNGRNVDVFWGPAHRLPGGLNPSIRKLLTVHDLVWRHAPETMRPANRMLETLFMPPAVRRADHIITVSNATRADVLREWPDLKAPVTTIYPGVTRHEPLDPSLIVEKWGIRAPYCLFIGTMEPRKNLGRLLEAFALAGDSLGDHCLVIAGGAGWGRVDIKARTKELGIAHKVLTTGFVDDRELATLLHNAQALAMPSLYEGFGLPLIDAMAAGVPVLTSNVSSMPEVVGDEGVLVDPLDVADIARGVREVLGSQTLRETSRTEVFIRSKLFDWDNASVALSRLTVAATTP